MSEDALDLDVVRGLCRDHRRCIVLAVLAEHQRRLTVNDLTKAVVRHEFETAITDVDAEVVSTVRDDLLEEQIPRLEAAELVEYDEARQIVEPTVELDRLRSHLLSILEDEPDLELPLEL